MASNFLTIADCVRGQKSFKFCLRPALSPSLMQRVVLFRSELGIAPEQKPSSRRFSNREEVIRRKACG